LDGLEKSNKGHLKPLTASLVLPIASTHDFRGSEAYKAYRAWFTKAGLSVSAHALVMPLYTCTLKELLEHGAPPGRLAGSRLVEERGPTGYSYLNRLRYAQRECLVLPILWQVSNGLRVLHGGGLDHHDVKPANILLRSSGAMLEAALADFGFIYPNQYPGTSTTRLGEALPLGTRHYRSTEQKDYFDICEVDVVLDESTPEMVLLVTDDRKFQDTIIEAGDSVVFYKDPARHRHEICHVDHNRDTGRSEIRLRQAEGDGDHRISSDQRTQVVFYKRHTARTDLFGVGAVLFDLLTAGRSPERFYDYLRPFDRADEERSAKEKGGGISALMTRYRALATAPSTVPGVAAIFEQLRAGEYGYPASDVVTILLRCLLSAPSDSYFRSDAVLDSVECFDRLSEDIKSAMDARDAAKYLTDEHPLWSGKSIPPTVVPRTSFAAKLCEVQRLCEGNSLARRLVLAYRVLRLIVNTANAAALSCECALSAGLLNRSDGDHSSERGGVFFYSLSPDNMQHATSGQVFELQAPTYVDPRQYYRAVLAGDALESWGGLDRDNFLPPCRRFGTRQVYLTEVAKDGDVPSARREESERRDDPALSSRTVSDTGDAGGAGECAANTTSPATGPATAGGRQTLRVRMQYLDSYPFWSSVALGDLVRLDMANGASFLLAVSAMSDDVVALDLLDKKAPDKDQDEAIKLGRAMLLKSLCPLDYYLGMIGIYIHQLFFVDGRRDTGSLPSTIWFVQQARASGFLDRVLPSDPSSFLNNGSGRGKMERRIREILKQLSRLYFWLVCCEYREDAPGGQTMQTAAVLFTRVRKAVEVIRRLVAKAIDVPEQTLEAMSDVQAEQENWPSTCPMSSLPTLEELLTGMVPRKRKSRFSWL